MLEGAALGRPAHPARPSIEPSPGIHYMQSCIVWLGCLDDGRRTLVIPNTIDLHSTASANNAVTTATPAATTAPPPPPQQHHNSLHNSATSATAAFMEREYLWCNSVFMVTDGSGIKSVASVDIDSGAPVVENGRQLPNKIFRHKQSVSWIK